MMILLLLALTLSACDGGGADMLTMTGTQRCTVTVCTNGDCQEVPCQKHP